ncbi:MAG: hypothetical protein ABUT20_45685, partial [Bacteroidota bacterium]
MTTTESIFGVFIFSTMELTGTTYQIQGLDVISLAKQFGTPLYIYDANTIIRQINNLKTAFAGA